MNSQVIDRKEAKKDKQREFNSKTKSLKKERRDNRERKYDSASEESMYYESLVSSIIDDDEELLSNDEDRKISVEETKQKARTHFLEGCALYQ